MYCKTLRDELTLAAAYRAGFIGSDSEALIDGVMLHQSGGIWQKVSPERRRTFEHRVAKGRRLLDDDNLMKEYFASNVISTD